MNPAIQAAWEDIKEAEGRFDRVVEETYKPGDIADYEHGRSIVRVRIIRPLGEKVLVESVLNEKQYRIYATRFIS